MANMDKQTNDVAVTQANPPEFARSQIPDNIRDYVIWLEAELSRLRRLTSQPAPGDLVEAFDMCRQLIQEAKGAEGPNGGFVTNHLDAAENWLDKAESLSAQAPEQSDTQSDGVRARPLEEWHEDYGDVVWWKFPITEPAMIGNPLDSAWPGYHTHWTPHPPIPAIRAATDGEVG